MMSANNPGKTALLIVDVQKGLDEPTRGLRNNPDAEANMAALLAAWREQQRPVIHVRHCSLEPDSPLRPELPGNAYSIIESGSNSVPLI